VCISRWEKPTDSVIRRKQNEGNGWVVGMFMGGMEPLKDGTEILLTEQLYIIKETSDNDAAISIL
jgi:hypothetical protein